MTPVEVNLEFTPNPDTLKYTVNRQLLLSGAEYYTSAEEAKEFSPLATALFDLGVLSAVMIGTDFVTITLMSQDDLRTVNQQIIKAIKDHIEAGKEICTPRAENEIVDEDEDAQKIREIIDSEIRPAVAQDGGDISFLRLEDNNVYVYMMGACSGCPSSTMTLKMGILNRLQQELPDIEDVIAV